MKYLILILTLISFKTIAQVSSGDTITAINFNNSTYAIGDIKHSILNSAEFTAIHGTCWKQMNQDVNLVNTDLGNHIQTVGSRPSFVSIPNASGLFLRNSGSQTLSEDGKTVTAGALGSRQGQATAPNGLTTDSSGNHQHIGGWAGVNDTATYGTSSVSGGGNVNTQNGTSTENHAYTSPSGDHSHTVTGGGSETRPSNLTINLFVKVSNDCSGS